MTKPSFINLSKYFIHAARSVDKRDKHNKMGEVKANGVI